MSERITESRSERIPFGGLFYRTCVYGWKRIAGESRKLLVKTLLASQGSGGLFRDPSGKEDLYYTFFGLLLATVADVKIRLTDCEKRVNEIDFSTLNPVLGCVWLRIRELIRISKIPFELRNVVSGIRARWRNTVTRRNEDARLRGWLDSLRTRPASEFPRQELDSPRIRFHLNSLYEDSGLAPPETDLTEYRLPSGLYTNSRRSPSYEVSATAAAIFLIHGAERLAVAKLLRELQDPDGSFRATESAPCGDLHSTSTALLALRVCGLSPKNSVRDFLRHCFHADGFFAAFPEDSTSNLEHTVYGLLAMGAISPTARQYHPRRNALRCPPEGQRGTLHRGGR